MSILPPAIFLMGPTASGKTGMAVKLAQHFPLEIISVDSALVFRGMDIGTAKPDAATLAQVPHHLIDIIDPTETYSAAAFRHDALRLMADISARGKVPLLVGGTMLYFKALREGLSPLPPADAEVRARLDAIIAQHGIQHLHAELAKVDAVTAARLHSTDTQRIQRAMEIFLVSGKPMSELIGNSRLSSNPLTGEGLSGKGDEGLPYAVLPIALVPSDRAALHQRIAVRFRQMLKNGLVEELRELRSKYPLHRDMTSMRCVGYRQAWAFLENEISESELLEQGIAATRQLAKRQLTWLRGMTEKIEVDPLTTSASTRIKQHLASFLSPHGPGTKSH